MSRPSPDQRLDHVIGMKLDGSWIHREHTRALAIEWGLSRREIERISSDADRTIARMFPVDSPEQREEARGRLLPEIDRHIEAADKAKHYGAVANLFKLKMALMGALVPHSGRALAWDAEKAKGKGGATDADPAQLTDVELLAKAKEAVAELEQKVNAPPAEGKDGMH